MKKRVAVLLALLLSASALSLAACQPEQSAELPPYEEPVAPDEPTQPSPDEEDEPSDETDEPSVLVPTGYIYCTGNGVNIRNAPSTSGKVVGAAYTGDKLDLLEKGEKWHSVLYRGEVAYVSATYFSSSAVTVQPTAQVDEFIRVTADGVNIRSAPSTSGKVVGTAKKGKYFAVTGKSGGYYKVRYRYADGYISTSYATKAQMKKSDNEKIERVLAAAYETVGTPYVYGATRLHGGTGILIEGFNKHKMDCSSLVQYALFTGAKISIGMNTATQQSQGKLVTELQRGDLLFFSSESYINHSLPTKIRHVGIYLGNDYMLHTANTKNNAEIINLKDTGYWWRYFVLARRHF